MNKNLYERLNFELEPFAKENALRLNVKSEKSKLIKELYHLDIPGFNILRKLFLTDRENSIINTTEKLKKLCREYYPDEMDLVGSRLKVYLLSLLRDSANFTYPSYADIPLKIVAKYCTLDLHYTAALYEWVDEELERKNLKQAAKYYNSHGYFGYILSRNGIAWNDDLASKLEKDYSKIALESLRSLILIPSMIDILRLSSQDILKIQSTLDREELKSYFNPMSSHRYKGEDEHKTTIVRMTNAICTTRIKFACILYEVYAHGCNLENFEDVQLEYPNLYKVYNEIIKLETIPEKVNFLENLSKNKQLLEDIQSRYLRNPKNNSKEFDIIRTYAKWKLESLDQDNVKKIYEIFNRIVGINPDKQENWIPEWQAFYYFKVYKKVLKSLDTYINGTCGRKSVEIIDKESAKEDSPLRISKYEPNADKDKVYIVNTSWGVCTAITKRWQAAQHTVPSSTELMDLRTSRFKDGIKVHFDYGQAEVRVLAKLAGETNLLKAFEQGIDVHKYSASIMWKKPQEEVTSEERRSAKAVTFSLLYGKSLVEFANDITNGDVAAAQNIFDEFFNAYPKLKIFILEMHRKGLLYDKVPSLFGDPIPVQTPYWYYDLDEATQLDLLDNPFNYDIDLGKGFEKEEDRKERSKLNKAKRNSQNYGIQSSSSLVAGLCMYEIQKKIEELGLSTKLECFTHDSCDMDLQVKDLIEVLDFLPDLALTYPEKEFDLPMAIDFEIGVSNNKMVELHNVVREGNMLKADFSGKRESLNLLLDKFEENGVVLNYKITEETEKMASIEEIFVTKRAYASALGKPYKSTSGKLELTFS